MIKAVLTADVGDPSSDASRYVLGPDTVLLLTRDGTARLLNLDGCFYALSATAATMLTATLRHGVAAATEVVTAKYDDADPRQVRQDLDALIHGLERRRLIYRTGSHRRKRRPRMAPPLLVLGPALRAIHLCCRIPSGSAWPLLTLAYLSIRLFGWSRTVAAWQRCVQPVGRRDLAAEDDGAMAKAIDDVVRAAAAHHLLNVSCKERALTCWTLLRSAGLPAALVLGVNLFPLASHAWCELGSRVLSDYEDRCQRFTPVLRYA